MLIQAYDIRWPYSPTSVAAGVRQRWPLEVDDWLVTIAAPWNHHDKGAYMLLVTA
jgi:hypothetical protein